MKTEHYGNEDRCTDFAFAPVEWRANDICHLPGCNGDTRKRKRDTGLAKLEEKINNYISKLPGGTKYPGLILALEMIEEVKNET